MALEAVQTARRNGTPLKRVLAYCHDSVGLGHLRRTLAICDKVGQSHSDASFLVVTGTPFVPLFCSSSSVDYLKLPALSKHGNGDYRSRSLSMSPEETLRCREAMLLSAAEHFRPDVLLVDKAPLGVARELVPTLRWLREHSPDTRIIFGMRDIEDAPDVTIEQWEKAGVFEAMETYFHEIWVYGTRNLFDVADKYALSKTIQEKLQFMGYIARDVNRSAERQETGGGGVLVTVGGGTDGERLLETYVAEAAGRVAEIGLTSRVVGGPDLPEGVAGKLRKAVDQIDGAEWIDFEGDMGSRIRQADLVVSMGGYNTLCEVASYRRPALVVPRTTPRVEQQMRAELWAQRGVVDVIDPMTLTPAGLADRVVAMLQSKSERSAPNLDLNGLDRVCARFDAFWREEACRASAVYL